MVPQFRCVEHRLVDFVLYSEQMCYFLPARHCAQRLRCAAAMRARAADDSCLGFLPTRGPKLVLSIPSALSAASMRARSCCSSRIMVWSVFMAWDSSKRHSCLVGKQLRAAKDGLKGVPTKTTVSLLPGRLGQPSPRTARHKSMLPLLCNVNGTCEPW